ncbi:MULTISPECIES: helix-turn-helix domain-containing protein [unclassified Sphingobacterium]|uniref:helix-turn-helix domain-containing protein n=1 Tax=unclassified Sphingobacterium TaxID=2609468 RepID=UPI00265CD673|nr:MULTISPECIES: helix-turn-helix domain-containing protein [unclassified Sphingobacterium]WKK57822.1 AAA family ATPase [Sphingobacterium sp. BN32]
MSQNFDTDNDVFAQAVAFVNQTQQPIFLTGKAGTGKTTFLKFIRENSYKKMAITAPTGVAAMNAGGTTLHALFWLPFGVFIEDYPLQWGETDQFIYNKHRLFSTIKLTKQRRAILQELELLVIDEVSMVRADTLDAIDVILKSVRRDMRPFGGVQVLFIGDLYQLPPVVQDREWQVLRDYYSSMFFFDAKVFKQHPPILIELKKIYRQQDDAFIRVLNSIRNNETSAEELEELNAHYKPDFIPEKDEQYITLTSHNRLADQINQEKLMSLDTKLHQIKSLIKDDFGQSMFPADENLSLRIGAQVMFIKNDTGEDRRYYNGKIGTVKDINLDKHQVIVSFPNDEEDVVVKRETWENIRYSYNKGDDKIEEEVLGTFSQFPLRLAWAITIHKSQGLTFEKAIVDAGTSFAAGQVYVALSRLTGLEGLVLRSKISPFAIRTDHQVVNFMKQMAAMGNLDDILQKSRQNYLGQILLHSFRWHQLTDEFEKLVEEYRDKKMEQKEEAITVLTGILDSLKKQEQVANKFMSQLHGLLSKRDEIDYDLICDRSKAAVNWFLPTFEKDCLQALEAHLEAWKVKKRTKKYVTLLKGLLLDFKRKFEQLKHSLTIAEALTKSNDQVSEELLTWAKPKDDLPKESENEKEKDTKSITLEMFQDGMEIAEIAEKRNMVAGTIYGHLINFMGTELEATDLMTEQELSQIVTLIEKNPEATTLELKTMLGPDVDYPAIRIAQRHVEILAEKP